MLDRRVLDGCLCKDLGLVSSIGEEEVRGTVDGSGAGPLHYAVRARADSHQQDQLLEYLLHKCGCKGRAKTHNGATPLHDACATGNVAAVSWLLSNTDSSAEEGDNSGILPVHLVSRFGHLPVLEVLVKEAHASLHVKTSNGARPLHFAAAAGHPNIVKFILENTASFHNEDEKHRDYGDTECPCCKLDHIVNVQIETGATPLYLACQNGNLEAVEHLIGLGNASVKILTRDGMSCLHAAAQSGHLNIVQYLVEQHKVAVDYKDLDGLTALHYASGNGQVHVVKWLVAHGARMLTDILGGTPLHTAAFNGNNECALPLLDGGCDPDYEDTDGFTAIQIAAKCGHFGFAGFITKWQRQKKEELKKQELDASYRTEESNEHDGPNDEDDYESVPSDGNMMSIPPPPSYPPPQVPEINRLKRQGRVEPNNRDNAVVSSVKTISLLKRLSSQSSRDHDSGEDMSTSSQSPGQTTPNNPSDQENQTTGSGESRSRTNSFKSVALTARLSVDSKRQDSIQSVIEGRNPDSGEINDEMPPGEMPSDPTDKMPQSQRDKIIRFKAVAKLTKLSKEMISQTCEEKEPIETPVSKILKVAPKRTNSLRLIGLIGSMGRSEENNKQPPQNSGLHTPEEISEQQECDKEDDQLNMKNKTSVLSTSSKIGSTISAQESKQEGGSNTSSSAREISEEVKSCAPKEDNIRGSNARQALTIPSGNMSDKVPLKAPNTDQQVGDHILSQLSHPDLKLSLRKAKNQAKGQSMMFFGAPSHSSKVNNLKEKITSRWNAVFGKQTDIRHDSVTYMEVPSQRPALQEGPEYDVPPPGIRPVLKHTETDTDREWFKQDSTPQIWDTEQTIDLMWDGLIDPDNSKEKPSTTVLTGEYDPKNFINQVPNIDTAGNELPPWKKMLIAKQMAEKEYQQAIEKKQQESEELKYKDMPVWKKVILKKQDSERNVTADELEK